MAGSEVCCSGGPCAEELVGSAPGRGTGRHATVRGTKVIRADLTRTFFKQHSNDFDVTVLSRLNEGSHTGLICGAVVSYAATTGDGYGAQKSGNGNVCVPLISRSC